MRILIADNDPVPYYNKLLDRLRRERPQDNVVVCNDALDAYELLKGAESNGFHLLILDEQMGGGDRDGTALLRRLHVEPLHRPPAIIYITNFFNQMPANQIAHSGTSVNLFLDKDSDSDGLLYRAIVLVARHSEGVSQQPGDIFDDQFIRTVSAEVDQILETQQVGYYSLDQQRIIGSLIRSFFTTLRMREEWTADDALELSVFMTEGLCRVYDLPDEAVNLIRRFMDIEEVLYTIPRYRDHFLHQIKVYLLGFCILNRLLRMQKLEGTALGKSNALKLWFMASAFHDIGYPFEKMKTWLDAFVLGVLQSPVEERTAAALVPMEFNWGALLGKRYNLYHLERIADSLCSSYCSADIESAEHRKMRAELVVTLAERVAESPDHGLFSSLIVQNVLRGRLADEEVDPVAVAVALHNRTINKAVRKTLSGLLNFKHDPLSFLLMFCDTAQEWGRSEGHVRKSRGSSWGEVAFDGLEFGVDGKSVMVQLRYGRDWTDPEERAWKDGPFEKYVQSLRAIWSSKAGPAGDVTFGIEYYYGGSRAVRKLLEVLYL